MKNVLLITSSPRGELSYSSKVASDLATGLGGNLTSRELWKHPLPYIDPAYVHASFSSETDRTAEQREDLALSDSLIEEVKSADVIVIGAGMINFGVPATLKTWIDYLVRSRVTFQYGESGPVGLITGKKVYLVLASGGVYSTGPGAAVNHLEPYLKAILGFIGLTDIETFLIEGVAMGPEATETALAGANARIKELVHGE